MWRQPLEVLTDALPSDKHDATVLGLLLHGEAFVRPHHRDDTSSHDREAGLPSQRSRCSARFVTAVANVGHALSIDHEGVATHPH